MSRCPPPLFTRWQLGTTVASTNLKSSFGPGKISIDDTQGWKAEIQRQVNGVSSWHPAFSLLSFEPVFQRARCPTVPRAKEIEILSCLPSIHADSMKLKSLF